MILTPKERKALEFSVDAHRGQMRKYTNEPYVVHCIHVAQATRDTIHNSEEVFCAALLHDTVEDTDVTDADIRKAFGLTIAMLVHDVTDVSRPYHGNRKTRKELDLQHLAKACPGAQTIKLCDLEDNTKSIVEHDPGFAVKYMAEKRALLDVLDKGDPTKHEQLSKYVKAYFHKIGPKGTSRT